MTAHFLKTRLALALLPLLAGGLRADGPALVLLSGPDDYYHNAHDGFRSCYGGPVEKTILPKADAAAALKNAITAQAPKVLFTVGTSASQAAADTGVRIPTVYAMVIEPEKRNYSFPGVSMDLQAADQVAAIRVYFPKFKTIGILYGPNRHKKMVEEFRAINNPQMKLVIKPIQDQAELLTAMTSLAREADCLLMLADPDIYPHNFAPKIILHALQSNLPLIAPSPAYVKAGALAGIYAGPFESGCQAAHLAVRLVEEGPAKVPAVPEGATRARLAVNAIIAERLRISLSDQALKEADLVIR